MLKNWTIYSQMHGFYITFLPSSKLYKFELYAEFFVSMLINEWIIYILKYIIHMELRRPSSFWDIYWNMGIVKISINYWSIKVVYIVLYIFVSYIFDIISTVYNVYITWCDVEIAPNQLMVSKAQFCKWRSFVQIHFGHLFYVYTFDKSN